MNKFPRLLIGVLFIILMFSGIKRSEAQIKLSIDTINTCPGAVTMTIRAQNLVGVNSISLNITYNAAVLAYSGSFWVNPAMNPSAYLINPNVPGVIYFSFSNITTLNMGTGLFATLTFNYLGGATPIHFDPSICDMTNLVGNPVPCTFVDGYCSDEGLVADITDHPDNIIVCQDESASFQVVSNFPNTYQWEYSSNNGLSYNPVLPVAPYSGTTSANLSISAVTMGMNGYLFRCKVDGICPPTDVSTPALLTVNPPVSVNAGSDIQICVGQSATVTGTASNVQNTLWTPLGTGNFLDPNSLNTSYNPSAADIAAGTVKLVLTGFGLTSCANASDTLVLTIYPIPVANAGNDTTICTGGVASLHGSGGTSFVWSTVPVQTSPIAIVSPLVQTTYTLTVTQNGCSDTDQATVFITPLPVLFAGLDDTICAGDSIEVTGQALNYSATNWATSGDGSFTSPAALTTHYTPGTGDIAAGAVELYFQVTPEDPCTQVVEDTMVLVIHPFPPAHAGNDPDICYGESITLTATGGTAYVWNTNPPQNTASVTVSPLDTTAYIVTVTANGCSKPDTVQVNVKPLPNIWAGNDTTICYGTTTTLSGTGGISYVWSNGALSPSITVGPLVTTTYSVTGTGSNGCKNEDEVKLIINHQIIVTTNPTNPVICAKDSVSFSASVNVAATVTWTPANGLSVINGNTTTASPAFSTIYTATATDALGCQATAQVDLTVNQLPIVQVHPANVTLCKGDTLSLTAFGAFSYYWDPPTGLSSNTLPTVFASPKDSISYTIVGTDINGCLDTTEITVNVNLRPIVNLPEQTIVCRGNNILLDATSSLPFCTYEWQDGSNAPFFYASEPGTYFVKVSKDGCFDVDSIRIIACSELFVANTFTPNGDGYNDYFVIQNNGDIIKFKLVIYNRWGERVFQTEDINEYWDGTMDGKTCPVGVYHWVLEYFGTGNVLLEKEGKQYGQVLLFR